MSSAEEAIQRAEALLTARDVLAARAVFHEAEKLGWDPDHCSGGRWIASMLAGDFESAWCEGDAIRARGAPDTHRFWQGEDITDKRVIVRSLHGFGDAVQMLRFAPRLRAMAESVVFEVPPRFVPLARCIRGVKEVITWDEDAPTEPPVWDVQVEVMEIPYLLRLHADELPYAECYLRVPPEEVARVAACMGEKSRPRIGVVWTCGEWNLTRRVPLELLSALIAGPDFEFWSLEQSSSVKKIETHGLRNANAICGDGLLALAATIRNVDLVITVDTLAAHLAGALGKPAWVMLQHAADWRWMNAREDSSWYPTLRLFRQRTPGDWTGVARNVQRSLREERLGFADTGRETNA